MVLTANVLDKGLVANFLTREAGVVNGAITIYEGAILNYEAANIGYVKLGTDTASEEFAGIADGELSVAAGDNTSDGTYTTRIFAKGSGKVFRFDSSRQQGTITIANIGDDVTVYGDDKIALAATTTNDIVVGQIVDVTSDGAVFVVI